MKKQRGKSRATHVAGDMRKQRLQSLLRVCVALLLPTLYLFYCLSGLYIIEVEILRKNPLEGYHVLIKGSHGMALERVVEVL